MTGRLPQLLSNAWLLNRSTNLSKQASGTKRRLLIVLMSVYIGQGQGQNQMRTKTEMFSHRFNTDGTVDSICRECYVTIATEQFETDLLAEEHAHRCRPELVEWYQRPIQVNHTAII